MAYSFLISPREIQNRGSVKLSATASHSPAKSWQAAPAQQHLEDPHSAGPADLKIKVFPGSAPSNRRRIP